jgi:hypothetical protein
MNERIEKLRVQALRWAGENINRNLYSDYEIHLKEYEKFAELIGRECLTLADSIRDDCHADGSSEQALGAAWVGLAIARHFGFEE